MKCLSKTNIADYGTLLIEDALYFAEVLQVASCKWTLFVQVNKFRKHIQTTWGSFVNKWWLKKQVSIFATQLSVAVI